MATAAQKDNDKEVNEAVAALSAFFQKYEKRITFLDEIFKDFKGLRHEVITLLNERDGLKNKNRLAAIELEKTEREAQLRLSGIEQGHRALVDKLNKQQVELNAKEAEVAKREAIAQDRAHRAELQISAYEQKIAALTKIEGKK